MFGSGSSSFGVPYKETSSKWTCHNILWRNRNKMLLAVHSYIIEITLVLAISLAASHINRASSSKAVTKESVQVLSIDEIRKSLSLFEI